jgi:hypothetical protein
MKRMDTATKKATFFSLRANPKNVFVDTVGLWSYPIFVRSGADRTLWMYLVSRTAAFKGAGTLVFRPHSALVTFPDSDKAVKYENFRFGKDPFSVAWDKPMGRWPHEAIRNSTVEEFEERERELIALSVGDTESFRARGSLSPRFKELYSRMTSPVFKNFIECLAPEFHSLVWE